MRASHRPVSAGIAVVALLLGSVSCGDVTKDRSPVTILIDSLETASGADPGNFSGFLLSDVQTMVEQQIGDQTVRVPIVYNDFGQATMRLISKDAGNGAVNLNPTPWNSITIRRYRVTYTRADGRNTPGLDVPLPIDGAVTATLTPSPVTVPFEVVRHQAKLEQPLKALAGFGGRLFITTIAEVTFFGSDAYGNDVQAKGNFTVNFSDFADPE